MFILDNSDDVDKCDVGWGKSNKIFSLLPTLAGK